MCETHLLNEMCPSYFYLTQLNFESYGDTLQQVHLFDDLANDRLQLWIPVLHIKRHPGMPALRANISRCIKRFAIFLRTDRLDDNLILAWIRR